MRLEIKQGANLPAELSKQFSRFWDVYVDGHHLGDGVKSIELKMDADKRPELVITCAPLDLDVDVEVLAKLFFSGQDETVAQDAKGQRYTASELNSGSATTAND